MNAFDVDVRRGGAWWIGEVRGQSLSAEASHLPDLETKVLDLVADLFGLDRQEIHIRMHLPGQPGPLAG